MDTQHPHNSLDDRAEAQQASGGPLGRLPRQDAASAPYIPTPEDPVEYVIHRGWIKSQDIRPGTPSDERERQTLEKVCIQHQHRLYALEQLFDYGAGHEYGALSLAALAELRDFFCNNVSVEKTMRRDQEWRNAEISCVWALRCYLLTGNLHRVDLACAYAAVRWGCPLPEKSFYTRGYGS